MKKIIILLSFFLLCGCIPSNEVIQTEPKNQPEVKVVHTSGDMSNYARNEEVLNSEISKELKAELELLRLTDLEPQINFTDKNAEHEVIVKDGMSSKSYHFYKERGLCYVGVSRDGIYEVDEKLYNSLFEYAKLEPIERMIWVDNDLYIETNIDRSQVLRSEEMAGKITSSVISWRKPTEHNQSNFGTGYQYQYSSIGKIDVLIDNQWIEFRDIKVHEAIVLFEGISYEGIDYHFNPYLRSSNYKNINYQSTFRLIENLDFSYQEGDILKITYHDREEDTADANKKFHYGEILTVEPFNDIYQIKHSIKDLIPFEPTKIVIEKSGYDDVQKFEINEIDKLLKDLSNVMVYEDFFELMGAGDNPYSLIISGENNEEIKIRSSFNIEIAYQDETIMYGYPYLEQNNPLTKLLKKYSSY